MTRNRDLPEVVGPDGANFVPASGLQTYEKGTVGSVLAEVNVVPVELDGSDETSVLQAQIDKFSARGGKAVVPSGNYSWLTPSALSIPVNKMVTWRDDDGSLPSNMVGAVETSGYRAQPYEGAAGAGSRPGAAFKRIIVPSYTPDPTVQNQQDSVQYIELRQPETDSTLASTSTGLRIVMQSKAKNTATVFSSDRDIKSIEATTVGEAFNAKVRSIRTTSIGLNGHYGNVTGIMAWATRTGTKPTALGGVATGGGSWTSGVAGPYLTGDAAIIGQVGPGIQAVFRAEGGAAAERPQFMFLQARGNQAVLPEIAVFSLHGGGNGSIMEVLASDVDTTKILDIGRTGKVAATAMRSNVTASPIADDAAVSITPPAGSGIFKFWLEISQNCFGEIWFRTAAGGGNVAIQSSTLGSLVTIGTAGTPLTGTTGTDGRLTIAVAGNAIYIENRTGASRNYGYMFMTN